MVNKRFLQAAERWKNPSLPDEKPRTKQSTSQPIATQTVFPNLPSESFIFSYDGPHKDFFQELIAKSNERFKGTKAEISIEDEGEVKYMNIIKKLGLVTTIYQNPQLKSHCFLPITPAQSEALLKKGKLTTPEDNWEDLALILYDKSQNGENPREAQALYNSLRNHRQELGLSQSDLEHKLIVVNAGLEKDDESDYGVKPIVIPGLTQAYIHEVLEKVGEEDLNFDGYGLNGGLPMINQLGEDGDRVLYMPDVTEDMGLRVLYRNGSLSLNARNEYLANSNENGRVNFAPQGQTPRKTGGKKK
jgi:hypothetical protein